MWGEIVQTAAETMIQKAGFDNWLPKNLKDTVRSKNAEIDHSLQRHIQLYAPITNIWKWLSGPVSYKGNEGHLIIE